MLLLNGIRLSIWQTIASICFLGYGERFGRALSTESAPVLFSSSNVSQELNHIPDYVMSHAPYVYLFSGEEYWPNDMSTHLEHTSPHLGYEKLDSKYQNPTLDDLDMLNQFGHNGKGVYLQSKDDPDSYPDWLSNRRNKPDSFVASKSKQELKKRDLGRSTAPAILIVVDKGEYVDAFWFFFYSFNLGNAVYGVRFGNHVGDWEHTVVRFRNGEPIQVFYSEHEWGSAYLWNDAEKFEKRASPFHAMAFALAYRWQLVTYSAFGTHAMYRTSGVHRYILPFGLLADHTDRGFLWDPTKNLMSYVYDVQHNELRPGDLTPDAPMGWFFFNGQWGDKIYPDNDSRQYRFYTEWRYVSGPTGPLDKNLGREKICQGPVCNIRIAAEDHLPRIVEFVEGEWTVTGVNRSTMN
jgi:hypothetical protein